jgi:hypothetical protein
MSRFLTFSLLASLLFGVNVTPSHAASNAVPQATIISAHDQKWLSACVIRVMNEADAPNSGTYELDSEEASDFCVIELTKQNDFRYHAKK